MVLPNTDKTMVVKRGKILYQCWQLAVGGWPLARTASRASSAMLSAKTKNPEV